MMKTILVFFGGCSSEYAVSLQSAYGVLTHLDPAHYQALPVGISRDGRWFYYTGPLSRLLDDSWQVTNCIPCALLPDRDVRQLLLLDHTGRTLLFDAAFPILHGKNGEDGTLQGLLELAHIPLIGCGTLASALCMDKDRAHRLVKQAGIRVPRSVVFDRWAASAEVQAAAAELGYPLFVKPLRAGSSFGISRVTSSVQLSDAVAAAFTHDSNILLEESIDGFEVGCAVLGRDTLFTGAVDEIELSGNFFDFTEKYTLKSSKIHCPARISPEKEQEIQQAAKTVFRALDCNVFARVDFFLTPSSEIVFNEVNTIPGFTSHSRYPQMMQAAGLDFSTLISRIIETGVSS